MWFSAFVGLAILLRIGFFLYFVTVGQFVDNDSALYLLLAENLLKHGVFSESAAAPFVPEAFRTPGYPVFLAGITALGMKGPFWVVFWQELIYSICIVIFYRFGSPLFDRKIVSAGVVFLLLDPGGLAYPKLIMSEIVFLFFFLGAMLATGWYFRLSKAASLMLAGVLMGFGALIRPAVQYLPVLVVFILLIGGGRRQESWRHATVLLLSFILVISPWLIRNYHYFDEIFVSGQTSNIIVNYHYPIILSDAMDIPREQANVLVEQRINRMTLETARELGRPLSVVETFQVEQQFALKELFKFPGIYLKHWLYGSLKTMNGPFITQLYDSLGVRPDRIRFADAASGGLYDGVIYYFKNLDWLFLVNLLLTIVMSGFALLGVISIMQSKDRFLWLMMLANFYFIFLAGPEGYPRFRFPVGLFWFIQAYLGLVWLMSVFAQWRGKLAAR